jgi:putative acetyltransferase
MGSKRQRAWDWHQGQSCLQGSARAIGTQLVDTGLLILKEKDCPFDILLGHPEYYPRFGFQAASGCNIRTQWDGVPDKTFMILVMDHEAMQNVSGVATFRDEFNDAL